MNVTTSPSFMIFVDMYLKVKILLHDAVHILFNHILKFFRKMPKSFFLFLLFFFCA